MRESLGPTKPKGAMKVKASPAAMRTGDLGRIPGVCVRAHYRPLRVLHHGGPGGSESVHVGTRKMVNYA